MASKNILGPMDEEVGTFIEHLGLNPNKVQRVIIDINAAMPMVEVHVQLLASTQSLEILTASDLVPEIKILD